MVVVRVCISTKSDNVAALREVLARDVADTSKFEGCMRYDVYQGIRNDQDFILYEEWDNQQNFDAYRESDYFKEIGGKIFPLLEGEPDSAYFEAEVLPQ